MYIFGVWMDSLDRKQKRCCTSPFCWITNLDFDNSPVSHCVEHPYLVERFSRFESFIDNVLHKLSQYQQPLTRFRLCLGSDKTISYCYFDNNHTCKKACFPEPARLYAWISYPLAQCSLRELDLSFHVRNSSECKLPPEIFTHQSLEVLRLDINLEIINGNNNEIPVICLPNLKLLHFRSFVFTEDDFLTRLVSNCPVLEDLSIKCWWIKADRLIITSNSLRRFVFVILKYHNEEKNSELVHINTPNLQYFKYEDMLAFNYILHLNSLVEACIDVRRPLQFDNFDTSFRKQLSLLRALSNIKHLTLLGWSIEGFYYAAVLKDPLPMFSNLRTLKLDALCFSVCNAIWDIVLLLIFHRSPLLEELVFLQGFYYSVNDTSDTCDFHDRADSETATFIAAWEGASWGVTQTIPSCCQSHLKRIMIYNCHGRDQELNMMKFLLGRASVLKEFVISMSKRPEGIQFDAPKFDKFKNELEKIPRASNSCSIIYSDDEPNYN
ncbi:F-box/LRR-repeat protein At4g14103-like [Silene latifolia]|uniref:F-box/LRR-repeat protein At4g14103-like n=1 Tax=Silene latifolia TaxID=37657 RepID=UPI003D77D1D9